MTTITKDKLNEFTVIFKETFWTELSEKDTFDLATELLVYTNNILLPNVELQWKK